VCFIRVYAELLKEKKQKAEEQKKKLSEEGLSKFMQDLNIKDTPSKPEPMTLSKESNESKESKVSKESKEEIKK